MSKKIRVGWDDLKPGDLIHVKGSTNTYKFVSYGSGTISGDPEKSHPRKPNNTLSLTSKPPQSTHAAGVSTRN